MKNIYLNSGSINDVFDDIISSSKDELIISKNEFNLAVDTAFFKGNINQTTFGTTITSIQVGMTFFDDTVVSVESFNSSSIVFAYCNEGMFNYSFGISGQQLILRNHHSAVLTNHKSVNTIMHFKKHSTVQFTFIKIETSASQQSVNDSLILNLKNTFLNKKSDSIFHDRQCPKIEEMISQITNKTDDINIDYNLKREIIESLLLLEIDKNTSPILKMTNIINNPTSRQIKQPKKIYKLLNQYVLNLFYGRVFNSKNTIFFK
jgi:hypothetical protein